MGRSAQPRLGFTVWCELHPGLSPSEEAAFARRIEAYLAERDLQFAGGSLCLAVDSAERSLSPIDQAELLDWLLADPAVCTATISPLVRHRETPALKEAGYLRVGVGDNMLSALTTLYRARRVSAEQYLYILGGFVRPVPPRTGGG